MWAIRIRKNVFTTNLIEHINEMEGPKITDIIFSYASIPEAPEDQPAYKKIQKDAEVRCLILILIYSCLILMSKILATH